MKIYVHLLKMNETVEREGVWWEYREGKDVTWGGGDSSIIRCIGVVVVVVLIVVVNMSLRNVSVMEDVVIFVDAKLFFDGILVACCWLLFVSWCRV